MCRHFYTLARVDVSNQEMKITLLLLTLFLSAPAFGEELTAVSKEEIAHLFSYLEKSECQYYRNGTWAKANEASAHLRKKYRYLQGKGLVSSAEAFIARVATQSSNSGKPDQVRCGTSDIVESATWFRAELTSYRKRKADSSSRSPSPNSKGPPPKYK